MRPTVIQIAGYLGAFAGLAGTVATLEQQADLGKGGVLLALGLVTVVLLLAGMLIDGHSSEAYQRMRSVFWFVSTLTFAEFVSVMVVEVFHVGSFKSSAFLVELIAALYAGALWLYLKRTLQQLSLFNYLGGALAVIFFPSLGHFLFGPPNLVGAALVLWAFSGVWVYLGVRGAVTPKRTALVLGSLTALVSPFVMITHETAAETLVLLTAIVLLGVGDRLEDRAVSGIAVAGLVVDAFAIVGDHFSSSTGASVTVLIIGLVLLGAALAAIASEPQSPAAPPTQPLMPVPPAESG